MREINKVIIHCSDSLWGDAKIIDEWHKERGWRKIGYHWVILNGYGRGSKEYYPEYDGVVQVGRTEEVTGAHTRGQNATSIGICLIGKDWFTPKQYESLERVVSGIQINYNISDSMVFGHRDFAKRKTCPNFDVSAWMKWMKAK